MKEDLARISSATMELSDVAGDLLWLLRGEKPVQCLSQQLLSTFVESLRLLRAERGSPAWEFFSGHLVNSHGILTISGNDRSHLERVFFMSETVYLVLCMIEGGVMVTATGPALRGLARARANELRDLQAPQISSHLPTMPQDDVDELIERLDFMGVRIDLEKELQRAIAALPQSTQAVRANTSKLFPMGELEDRDLAEFAVYLNTHRGNKMSDNEIARQYTGETIEDWPKAAKLLARYRTNRNRGKIGI